MGKSPAKWIKTILAGKKTSKSNLSKGRDASKLASEKGVVVSTKEPASDIAVDPPFIPPPVSHTSARAREEPILEKEDASRLPDGSVSSAKQDDDAQIFTNMESLEYSERIRLEQAAIKAQAAFKGYLARRAFRALKGIIRLQALIRGHLVRRQAIATLYCVHRIVKLQALVRGEKDLKCVDYWKTCIFSPAEKLWANAFAHKLLSFSTTTTPLSVEYGPDEPNSAWNWLNRWTVLRLWEPSSQPKKIINSKSQKKHESLQTVEVAQVRPKKSVPKLQPTNGENGSSKSTLESDKLKWNPKKASNNPITSVPKHPQNGNGKVKRNPKKTSNPTTEASIEPEMDREKLKHIHTKASNLEQPEKVKSDIDVAVIKPKDMETTSKPPEVDGSVDLRSTERNGKNEDIPGRRRASLPADQDYQEKGLDNTPRVPSYMVATQSAKAKFRGQNSPRLDQDGSENNGLTRRYSLPSSTNGKLSLSPRVVEASGRGGGIRSDRSLSSSRDEKVIQAEWKR